MGMPKAMAIHLQSKLRDKRWMNLCQIDREAREAAASWLWPHSMGNSGKTPDGDRVLDATSEELRRG